MMDARARRIWKNLGFWGRWYNRLPYRFPFRTITMACGKTAGYVE